MALANLYQLSPILWGATPNVLAGIQRCAYNPNVDRIAPDTDGRATKTHISIGKKAPALEIQTLDLGEALALTGMDFSGLIPLAPLTSLKFIGRKESPTAPTFSTSADSEQLQATGGILFMTGIEAQANTPAVMSLMAAFTSSDGVTDPVAATQITAPTDPLLLAPWVLDSVSIDGVDVPEVTGVSISTGAELQSEFGAKVFPRLTRVRKVDWMIKVVHNSLARQRLTLEKAGAMVVVLKQLNTGGPTRGSGTITITVTGTIFEDGTEFSQQNVAVTTSVQGRHDGTNNPVTITVV